MPLEAGLDLNRFCKFSVVVLNENTTQKKQKKNRQTKPPELLTEKLRFENEWFSWSCKRLHLWLRSHV